MGSLKWGLAALTVATACGRSPAIRYDAGADVVLPQAACSRALTGTAPFGASLHGEADFHLEGYDGGQPLHSAVDLAVYFPNGRVAGAPVVFAVMNQSQPAGADRFDAVLDSHAAVPDVHLQAYADVGFDLAGSLRGPTDGLFATVHRNEARHSDNETLYEADLALCPTGDAPAPTLSTTTATLAPNSTFYLSASAPIDPAGLAITAQGDHGPIAVSGTAEGRWIRVAPVDVYPPGSNVTFTVAPLHDVIGRLFTVGTMPTPLHTTAVLADPTFAADATPGSVVASGTVPRVADGALQLDIGVEAQVLIALGDRGAATHVRVTGASLVRPARGHYASYSIVTADGQHTDIAAPSGGAIGDAGTASDDLVLPLPGTGPVWLSIYDPGPRTDAAVQYGPPLPPDTLGFDAITFE